MESSWLHSSVLTLGMLLLVGGTDRLAAEVVRPQSPRLLAPSALASPNKVTQYVRDRFQVPENIKLTAEPLSNSPFPIFYQTIVTSDDGKQKRADNVFLTKDGRCFVMGSVFAVQDDSTDGILRCVRKATQLPPRTALTLRPFGRTPYPEFLKSVVTATDGKHTQSTEIFITRDHRVGILGVVLPFGEEFVRSIIKTKGEPSLGPSTAPVTIVEYADLQCPTCARLHEFLQKEIVPKYGDKVRVIFKEFPIPSHDWSRNASIANECVYQISPSIFPEYRRLIFANQSTFTASNARDRLLTLGDESGIDRSRLGACLDTQASLWRVEAGRKEAEDLGVDRTPTSFVNGRTVIGMPPARTCTRIIDEALLAAKNSRPTVGRSGR